VARKQVLSREQLIKAITALIDLAIESGREALIGEMLAGVSRKAPAKRVKIAPAREETKIANLELPLLSPQKRGARDRAPHGEIKATVNNAIYAHPQGIKRPEIVEYARDRLGVIVKPGSLKNAIRLLKADRAITNREGKWFPTHGE
jgi:hypothetical protein